MADARRIDERIEFSLSSRSAVALVTGGGLVLVLVFALGVLLGRQLARPPTAARPVIVKADTEAAEESEDGELSFTFHERLVSDRASPLRAAATPAKAAPKPAPKPVAEPAAAREKPEVVVAAANEAAQPSESKPLVPAPQAESESESDLPVDDAAEASAPVEEAAPETPAAGTTATTSTAVAAQAPESPAAITVPTAAPTPPPSPSAASDDTRWSVQFGAAPNREDAERLKEQLRAKGVPAYVIEVDLPDKGRFFRVRAGRFAEKSAAEKMRAEARAVGFDGILMR